jgi:hypothetical protein
MDTDRMGQDPKTRVAKPDSQTADIGLGYVNTRVARLSGAVRLWHRLPPMRKAANGRKV